MDQTRIVAAIFGRLYTDSLHGALHGEELSAEQRHLTCRSSQQSNYNLPDKPKGSRRMSSLGPSIRTQDLKRHSIWTLSAIGFLAYYITVMWHEIIGHGSMMYLFGVRHFVLTSTSISMDALLLPARAQNGTVGGRLIAMNGAISNVILGVALY